MNEEKVLEQALMDLKDELTLTDRVRKKMDGAYAQCLETKSSTMQSHYKWKYALLFIGIVVGVGISGICNPTWAKGTPFYQVFSSLNETLFKGTVYEKFAEPKQMVVIDKNIEMTIEEVFCDQREIGYTYTLRSYDKPLKEVEEVFYNAIWIEEKIEIDGEELKSNQSAGGGEYIDDYTYKGEKLYRSHQLLPEAFKLKIHITEFESRDEIDFELKGNWKFETDVMKHTTPFSHVVAVDESLKFDMPELEMIKIQEIGFTPLRTYLTMEAPFEIDEVLFEKYSANFTLIDNLGQVYVPGNGGCSLTKEQIYQWHLEFSVPDMMPEWIAIVPSVIPLPENDWIPEERVVTIPYEEQLIIKRENVGDYRIESVENKGDGVSVQVALAPMQNHAYLTLELKDGTIKRGEKQSYGMEQFEIYYEDCKKEDIAYFLLDDTGESYQMDKRVQVPIR
ncbi:MAG: DUF4179 domain-containing protein [Cellulosilyticaceae bacterium]